MFEEKKLEQLYKEMNGIFKYADLIELGLTQRNVKNLEKEGTIKKVGKGIYIHKDYFVDMLKVYQMENAQLIYSHETAAYLHNLTDRFPRKYSVTTQSGYHLRKYNELKVYYIKKDLLDLGVVELKDPAGNWVRTYDKERTICDIIKGKDRIELQVYTEVIQNYFKGKVKMNKLSKYAKELGISEKVYEIVSLMKES